MASSQESGSLESLLPEIYVNIGPDKGRDILESKDIPHFIDSPDGLTPLARILPGEESLLDFLGERVTAIRVRPGIEISHILNAIGLLGAAFAPKPEMPWQRKVNYSNIPSLWGRTCFEVICGRPYEYDDGKLYEMSAVMIYMLGGMYAGTGGIYRDLAEPDIAWGLCSAVAPVLQGKGFQTRILIPHTFSLVKQMGGKDKFSFFTEKYGNERVIAHYGRLGAGWENKTIRIGGEEQIIGYFSIEDTTRIIKDRYKEDI